MKEIACVQICVNRCIPLLQYEYLRDGRGSFQLSPPRASSITRNLSMITALLVS
eukprot:COSAG02_NODE_7201_length_3122_cov_3.639762_5_plen_54_part_00